jgi:hypothetical protein
MALHTITIKSDEEMEDEADAFAGAFLLRVNIGNPLIPCCHLELSPLNVPSD